MLFGIILSAFLKGKNKKNEIEKSLIVSEKIHFFPKKMSKKCRPRNEQARKIVFFGFGLQRNVPKGDKA